MKITVKWQPPRCWTEVEQLCKEDWWKTAIFRCAMLVQIYQQRLRAVIAAKGAFTNFWLKGGEYLCSPLFVFAVCNHGRSMGTDWCQKCEISDSKFKKYEYKLNNFKMVNTRHFTADGKLFKFRNWSHSHLFLPTVAIWWYLIPFVLPEVVPNISHTTNDCYPPLSDSVVSLEFTPFFFSKVCFVFLSWLYLYF